MHKKTSQNRQTWALKFGIFFISLWITSAPNNISAHPWGGLVIDQDGTIYFSFVSPLVSDNHYACVWAINNQNQTNETLKSLHSPSDLILSRTPQRTIYAAERNNAGQAQLWKIEGTHTQQIIAPTTDQKSFYVQAYAVTDTGIIFFAREDRLYQKNKDGTISEIKTQKPFTRIDGLAWGPNNKLYIMDRGDIKILETNGSISTLITGLKKENPEDLPFSGANILFDFAVDNQGNVYVAYYGNRRILKITAQGKVSDFLTARPWSPHGVDVYNGEVYVLESISVSQSWWAFWEKAITIPRVRKVDVNGTVSTIFQYQLNEQ